MSANAKANAKQQEINDLMVYILQMFIRIIKRGCIFHSILVGIPFILILSVKNRGREGVAKWTKSVKRDKSYLSTVPKRM